MIMKKFTYLIVKVRFGNDANDEYFTNILNEYGRNGYELCVYTSGKMIFKKEIPY